MTLRCCGDLTARRWSFVPRFGDKGNKSSDLFVDDGVGALRSRRLRRRRGLMRSLPPGMGLVNIHGDAQHSTLGIAHAAVFHSSPIESVAALRALREAGL